MAGNNSVSGVDICSDPISKFPSRGRYCALAVMSARARARIATRRIFELRSRVRDANILLRSTRRMASSSTSCRRWETRTKSSSFDSKFLQDRGIVASEEDRRTRIADSARQERTRIAEIARVSSCKVPTCELGFHRRFYCTHAPLSRCIYYSTLWIGGTQQQR